MLVTVIVTPIIAAANIVPIIRLNEAADMVQVREQQAQEANEHQVADLKQAVKAAQEEAADLQTRLATVVPRDKLTAAEQRIKVCMHELSLKMFLKIHIACPGTTSQYPLFLSCYWIILIGFSFRDTR